MNHQQWAEIVQNFINKIELTYPHSSQKMREEWKKQLKKIKETCDDLLVSWAVVEDSIANICQQYPDLLNEDEHAIEEEEFYLTESSLRQFREGQGYYRLAMYNSAAPLLERLVQNQPDFLLGRVFLGLCLYQQKRWEAAREQFEWLTQFAHSNEFKGFASHMLGCIDLQVSKPEGAKQHFAKTIALLPHHADAWFNLAISYYQLMRYQDAISAFLKVLSLNGDDWESMYFLSKCYAQLQQKENVAFWRYAALEKANHPQVIEAIAHDYEEIGEYKKAIYWYRRLLHLDRKQKVAYRGMAWNHWMLRDPTLAMGWIKKGLSLFPQDLYLLALYVWICLQHGQMIKAKDLLRCFPDSMDDLKKLLLSHYFSQTGDRKNALELADQMIQQERLTISGFGHYQKGRVLLEMGETNQALQHFQQAKELVANWKDPIFYEGVCHLILKNPVQTRSCWEKIDFYV